MKSKVRIPISVAKVLGAVPAGDSKSVNKLGYKLKPIEISKSKTADSRTCDHAKVSKEQLELSSIQHIQDVAKALRMFQDMLSDAASNHDHDKLSDIDGFHSTFINGFKDDTWLVKHKQINRHHILKGETLPKDVNLLDVLEMVSDCVMAGMARSGEIFPLEMDEGTLQKAFDNTVELLNRNVKVK